MSWMWINLPLAIVFFGAWTGIPLYMVLRHPSWGAESAHHSADALVSPQGGEADWEMLVSASAVVDAVH